MKYTKEELLESIKVKDGYASGEAWDVANEYTNEYDWDNEWEAFDPQEAMTDAVIFGIRWAMEHLK